MVEMKEKQSELIKIELDNDPQYMYVRHLEGRKDKKKTKREEERSLWKYREKEREGDRP